MENEVQYKVYTPFEMASQAKKEVRDAFQRDFDEIQSKVQRCLLDLEKIDLLDSVDVLLELNDGKTREAVKSDLVLLLDSLSIKLMPAEEKLRVFDSRYGDKPGIRLPKIRD